MLKETSFIIIPSCNKKKKSKRIFGFWELGGKKLHIFMKRRIERARNGE